MGFKPTAEDGGTFQLFSRANAASARNSAWTMHVEGKVRLSSGAEAASFRSSESSTLDQARGTCSELVDVAEHYNLMWRRGVEFGPSFRGVEKLWRGPASSLAQIQLSNRL